MEDEDDYKPEAPKISSTKDSGIQSVISNQPVTKKSKKGGMHTQSTTDPSTLQMALDKYHSNPAISLLQNRESDKFIQQYAYEYISQLRKLDS